MNQEPARATSARVAAKGKRDDMMDVSDEGEAPSAPAAVGRKKSKGASSLVDDKPIREQTKVNDKLIPTRMDRLRSLYYDARFNVLRTQRIFEGHDERAIERAIERGNMVWTQFIPTLQKYNMLIKTKSMRTAAKEVIETLTSGTVPLPCIIEATEIIDNEAITIEAELLFAGAPHAEVTKKETGVNYEFYVAYGDLKDSAYYEFRCPFVYVIRRVSKPTSLLQSVVGTHFSSFHAFFRLVTNNTSVDGFDKWKLHGTQISMRDVLKKYSFQNCINKEDTLTFPVLRNVYKVKTSTVAIEELVPNMPCTIDPDIGRAVNAAAVSASAASAQGTESALNAEFEQSLRANTYAETVRESATVSVVDVLLAQCLYECNGITCDPVNCQQHDLMNTKGTWKCRHDVVHWDRINLDPKNNVGNDLIMDNSVLIRMHKDKENKNFKLDGYGPKWHTRLRHDEYGRSVWDNRVFFSGNDMCKAITAPRDLDECRLYGYSYLCTFLQPYKERHYGFYETELLARDVVSNAAQFDALINSYHPTILSTFKQNAAVLQGGVYRQTYALRLPQHLVLVKMNSKTVLPKLVHTIRETVFYVPVETLLTRSPTYSTLATMFEPFPGSLHEDFNIKDVRE
jgi:hypothetical protein